MRPASQPYRNRTRRLTVASSRRWLRQLGDRRVVALLALSFFSLQTSRFYLPVPLSPHECPVSPPGVSEAIADTPIHTHDHSHSHDYSLPLDPTSSNPGGGYYFQHCKDHLNGIGLTPIQPLGTPIAGLFPWQDTPSYLSFPSPPPLAQGDASTFFHPPRHLG